MTQQTHDSFGHRAGAQDAIPARIPRLAGLDHTLRLIREGYDFIGGTCDRLGTDGFRTRLMGRPTVCLRGPDAARLLYGADGLTRQGAMPWFVLRLLQDKGSVQQMEGPAHRERKAMFIRQVMDPARLDALVRAFEAAWRAPLVAGRELVVLDHANAALTRAACHWLGLYPDERRLEMLTQGLFSLSDRAGRIGPATVTALLNRRRIERWLAGELTRLPQGHPLSDFAALPGRAAVTETLNLLRPIVAVGRYIAFSAKALHENPIWCEMFTTGNSDFITDFCEEVRRTAPFFPFTAAVTTREVEWRGTTIAADTLVLFDIYGTARDPRAFPQPDTFRPERMLDWQLDDPSFAPQGTGDVATTHRCPGEAATLRLMQSAVRMLCCDMRYDVPPQDLSVARNRIPARPASGVRIRLHAQP